MNNIELICESINRRIYTMSYSCESDVRGYLNSIEANEFKLSEGDSDNLADMLDVNTNCIFDLLSDLELID